MNKTEKGNIFSRVSAALLAGVLMVLGCASCVTEKDEPVRSLQPGDMLPEFSVVLSTGERLTTSMLRGQASVIVFFDTSCPDCRRVLPLLQKEYEERGERGDSGEGEAAEGGASSGGGARYVCISRAEGEASVEQYWRENHFTMPYSAQTDRSVYNLFASSGIPRVYRADASLRIVSVETY